MSKFTHMSKFLPVGLTELPRCYMLRVYEFKKRITTRLWPKLYFCSGMLVGGVCGIAGVVSGKDNVLDKFMSKRSGI